MKLTSRAFEPMTDMPALYTCDGKNISPPLDISEVPTTAKSLVLLMDDPDIPASTGRRVWDHWIVYNMPATTAHLDEGVTPPGKQGVNGRGNQAYGGPCPPDKRHRYFFKLFALDSELDFAEAPSKDAVIAAMEGHVVDSAELIGTYDRKR